MSKNNVRKVARIQRKVRRKFGQQNSEKEKVRCDRSFEGSEKEEGLINAESPDVPCTADTCGSLQAMEINNSGETCSEHSKR